MDRGQLRRPLAAPIRGAFTGAFLQRAKAVRRFGRPFQIAAGITMVLMASP